MKRFAFEYVLGELGLTMNQSTYFEEWGHMGQNDTIVSIEEGLKAGKSNAGDLVCMAVAEIGYTWSATCIKWG